VNSIEFFTKKFGFKEQSRSDVFKEATLVSQPDLDARVQEALGKTTFVEEEFPDQEIESLRARGNAAFAKHDFVNAIKFYDEAIAIDAKDEVLRGNRSAARLRAGEMFAALSDATVCLELSKDYIKGRHRLGNAWAALGYEENAKEVYREATKAFPDHQQAFDEIAKKAAESSIARNPAIQLPPIVTESLKLAPRAVNAEVEIELHKTLTAESLRFGVILYIWEKLSGPERFGVYEECVRAGYAGTSAVVPTAESLAKSRIPPFPQACPKTEIPTSIVQYVESLGKNSPLERVAGLVLLFEGCSLADRETVAKLLLEVVKTCE
jgi:tetratricopeptide (TPR) repeat protein